MVPGDIVFLASGMRVPADVRLFRTTELNVEEATLTGESLPVEKTGKPVDESNLTPGDQVNMALVGTIVVSGRGTGVVVNTGENTVLGHIARKMESVSVTVTPLQQKIVRFAHFVGFLVLGSAAAIAVMGFFLGMTVAEIFKIAVAASVAAVPEGLPVVVTITMAIGVSRMAKRHAIIRKLPAVETLGSTTIICSDKTGTLTKNEMTVKAIYDGHRAYEVTGSGYDP
jgi:P-type Ca2+ transporter type 2C